MTKTVIIPDDIHLLIIKKQIEIREKYRITPRITDMLVAYIKAGLDRTEELLNIKKDGMGDSMGEHSIDERTTDEHPRILVESQEGVSSS